MKPPTLEQIRQRAQEIELPEIEADKFFNYWSARGWIMSGGQKMKSWRHALATWAMNVKSWRFDLDHRATAQPKSTYTPPHHEGQVEETLTQEQIRKEWRG